MRRTLGVILLMAGMLGCSESSITSSLDGLTANVQSTNGIEIHNRRSRPVYYIVMDSRAAASSLWVPCVEPARCKSVASGQTVRVPASEITGWGESDTVIVYWWHLVSTSNGVFKADEIRSYEVPPPGPRLAARHQLTQNRFCRVCRLVSFAR